MGRRDVLFFGVVVSGLATLGGGLLKSPASTPRRVPDPARSAPGDLRPIVADLDDTFRRHWAERGLRPTDFAPELAVVRRLSLALTGTIPSLEEIRRFESRPPGDRVEAWLDELLHDRRYADYLAERFARAYVGIEDGPFIVFRRSKLTTWLSDALLRNRPYDAVVRDLIADQGLWTDHAATNFVSVTFNPDTGRPDPERLGGRVARAFLGVRLDCAQCHDHPFQRWKQDDFRGLAAFFGGVHSNILGGIWDGAVDYKPPERKTKEPKAVEPRVPFRPELRPSSGSPRAQLAAWVVDRRNPNFARATVNRVWALVFGRPLSEPVDDIPTTGEVHPALDRLAADFSGHGYDLGRLIRVIAASRAFRLDSAEHAGDGSATEAQEEAWASFPMTRLRPEQVAGALFQAASFSTLGPQSSWVVRFLTYTGQNDFVRRYGDTGEDEFDARGGTIPQRLLLMNGNVVRNNTKDGFFSPATRIAQLAPTDRKAVEVAYLTVLTRRPTLEESAYFEARLKGTKGPERTDRLADLYWTLLNATEFSWGY